MVASLFLSPGGSRFISLMLNLANHVMLQEMKKFTTGRSGHLHQDIMFVNRITNEVMDGFGGNKKRIWTYLLVVAQNFRPPQIFEGEVDNSIEMSNIGTFKQPKLSIFSDLGVKLSCFFPKLSTLTLSKNLKTCVVLCYCMLECDMKRVCSLHISICNDKNNS